MFQNSYQNGAHFDFFDPKVNPDKLKPLYKPTNLPANHKIFDKDLKTYVLESSSPTGKMVFPRQQRKDLYLIQQYLVMQIYFFPGMAWNIELTLCDLTKTKRRVVLSPATTKTQIKPFFVKMPCQWQEGLWNNLTVDLYSYMDAFKGQTYRSLDSIMIGGHFKLRRIYTTPHEPPELNNQQFFQEIKQVNFLPKQFTLPMGVPSTTLLNRYNPNEVSQLMSEIEPSTKNSSFLKPKTRQNSRPATKPKIEQKPSRPPRHDVKVEEYKTQKTIQHEPSPQKPKIQQKEIKKKQDFLSSTNADVLPRRNKDRSVDKNALSQKVPKTRGKSNPKGINPWRNHKKSEEMSQSSQLAVSNQLKSNRKANTPDNISSMKKVTRVSEMADTKKNAFDGYSDSEYVELSQKFSTFTDGKFLRSGVNPLEQVQHQQEHQDQIQENIELQTNSLYESRKVEEKPSPQKPTVRQSFNDSLDMFKKVQNQPQDPINASQDLFARSSLYGFGQNLMRNYMQDIERPYSPPLGERDPKQQQQSHNACPLEKEQVELMFDPVLNCYYDYRTHTYYQLKN